MQAVIELNKIQATRVLNFISSVKNAEFTKNPQKRHNKGQILNIEALTETSNRASPFFEVT